MKPFLALLLLLAAARVEASPRLGAATLQDSLACVTFTGERLRAGTHLYFILFSPPRVVDGVSARR